MNELRTRLDRLESEVPMVSALRHGPSLGLAGSGVDYALTVDVEDANAFHEYLGHPVHDHVREIFQQVADEVRTIQFKLDRVP
jgi:hypothetical protein